MNIVFIGAGNVATHLAKELYKNSFQILQIYSRTIESATLLANEVGAIAINSIEDITPHADIYIFSVKDSILPQLVEQLPENRGLWLHTAGSISIDIFQDKAAKYGVLYPFQTFSKNKNLDFKNIPLFIEANNTENLDVLELISNKLSDKTYRLASDKRQYLHLTGVFACNFVNHMYAISEEILKQQDIPFDVVLALIDETAAKVHSLSPRDAQTGPAIRYDDNVINKHLSMIENSGIKDIYQSITENIHKTSIKK